MISLEKISNIYVVTNLFNLYKNVWSNSNTNIICSTDKSNKKIHC